MTVEDENVKYNIKIEAKDIEKVKTFKCLGRMIKSRSKLKHEIDKRP